MDVAVVGAGSIGCMLASEVVDAGNRTVVCARSPFDRIEITSDAQTRSVPVTVATAPEDGSPNGSPADVILVATKAQDTEGARPWIASLGSAESTVVLVQNGVDHVARLPDPPHGATVLPALIVCAVERTAPGRIRHYRGNTVTLPDVPAARPVAELLAGTRLRVVLEPDFVTAAWRKLMANVVANPITTLTLRRAEVLREPDIRVLAEGLLAETITVGRACGAQLGPSDRDATLAMYDAQSPDGGTSMLYDRLAGRRLEQEYLLAPVVDAGHGHGIPTPLCSTLLALVRALDASTLRQHHDAG